MNDETTIDRAHARMMAGDDADRLGFFQAIADAELYLWLKEEPEGDDISPEIYRSEEGQFVLAFDTEVRLVEIAQATVPRIAIAGRALAHMLSESGVGLALNMGEAPSAILLPAEAMAWLVETLAPGSSQELDRQPVGVRSPDDVSEKLKEVLLQKLSRAAGHASRAYLATAIYADNNTAPIIAFVDATPGVEAALRDAVSEALVFSGANAAALDVAFLDGAHAMVPALASVAIELDMSVSPLPEPQQPSAPGMDPSAPPRLK